MKSILYLDSKIHGAMDQLVKYFDDGVFDKNCHFVLFKEYKSSCKYYKSMLSKHGIRYKAFKSFETIDLTGIRAVFYLFNAQSNCRMVAFRQVKHIFVTHGESHKIASVKPIIRIYDYIICAGPVSLDRYLQAGVFSEHDIQSGRLLTMGDTFIGQSEYYPVETAQGAFVLYAPTWEGGVESENFSSINSSLESFERIIAFCKSSNIKQVILQPHPNLGHRDKAYLSFFEKGIKLLLQQRLSVVIRGSSRIFSLTFKFELLITKRVSLVGHGIRLPVCRAFVDISAMEAQLVSRGISTNVFFTSTLNAMPKSPLLLQYYEKIGIQDASDHVSILEPDHDIFEQVKSYYFSYYDADLMRMDKAKRVTSLLSFILNGDE